MRDRFDIDVPTSQGGPKGLGNPSKQEFPKVRGQEILENKVLFGELDYKTSLTEQ
jgi:hypothetical protein